MSELRSTLLARIANEQSVVANVTMLFPYGDWTTYKLRQLKEIHHDLRLGPQRYARSIGGRRVLEQASPILEKLPAGINLAWIGHSAGGVAGLHAAAQLLGQPRIHTMKVIMIGAPRCPIPQVLQDHTCVLRIHRIEGKRYRDPVTRIGRWRGRINEPKRIRELPIVGGHADYFRQHLINKDGRSNLQRTTDEILEYMYPQFKAEREEM